MAARKPKLASGVLAANVQIHGAGPNGESVWFGPSYPDNGEPPAEFADNLPPHVWDVRKVWPTEQDAAAVGLAWDEPAPAKASQAPAPPAPAPAAPAPPADPKGGSGGKS